MHFQNQVRLEHFLQYRADVLLIISPIGIEALVDDVGRVFRQRVLGQLCENAVCEGRCEVTFEQLEIELNNVIPVHVSDDGIEVVKCGLDEELLILSSKAEPLLVFLIFV